MLLGSGTFQWLSKLVGSSKFPALWCGVSHLFKYCDALGGDTVLRPIYSERAWILANLENILVVIEIDLIFFINLWKNSFLFFAHFSTLRACHAWQGGDRGVEIIFLVIIYQVVYMVKISSLYDMWKSVFSGGGLEAPPLSGDTQLYTLSGEGLRCRKVCLIWYLWSTTKV